MADITTFLQDIEKVSDGESVRDTIIKAIRTVNSNVTTDANTLDGHPASDFLTSSELESTISDISRKVDDVNNETMELGITNKLDKAISSRNDIATAISEKGGLIATDDPLSSYAQKIRDLEVVSGNFGVLNVNKNGSYNSSTDGYDGYKTVNVDVQPNLTELTVNNNGTYLASAEDSDGFRKVIVDVRNNNLVVVFMDSDNETILQIEKNVLSGENVTYTGETPVSDDTSLIFIGWNPNPVNVTTDMICYPEFAQPLPAGEITDSWDTIIDNKGAKYSVGSWKVLELLTPDSIIAPISYYNTSYTNPSFGFCKIEKVYSKEDESTSTWLCKTIPSSDGRSTNMRGTLIPSSENYLWSTCNLREWLNTEFLNKVIPENIRNSIKAVTKYSRTYSNQEEETIDKIWIPSYREMATQEEIVADSSNNYIEENGVNYGFSEPAERLRFLQPVNIEDESSSYVVYPLRSRAFDATDSSGWRVQASFGINNTDGNMFKRVARANNDPFLFGFCL